MDSHLTLASTQDLVRNDHGLDVRAPVTEYNTLYHTLHGKTAEPSSGFSGGYWSHCRFRGKDAAALQHQSGWFISVLPAGMVSAVVPPSPR